MSLWLSTDYSIKEIDEEKYEIEFDEFTDNGNKVAGIKFYRILGNRRVLKYTESKEPLTVSLTMKDQVNKYLAKFWTLYTHTKNKNNFFICIDLYNNLRL